ncbi:AKT serine/threonine kinase 2 [Homo sapiens]|uniref:AKT serine/threonine kinase 2 n=1 Tax=Homo sapiens TaxID=9606 RepID=J3KT31_HUMAN|nr:AKT serine/threonine kinase 2 [Homo sapiens]KAI2591044.1 AKT serine/threonine kinase 2 [Homo sapiens]KAI2591045.1 AKT serine/threonine kinase 2 [Homo sapiens]KAI4042694.1 AKT serine/threonine kinase 2 [Homo sapiens]KAI4042696.1 AKT serine/threonine kinase 2 [Homo sapiens]
MPADEDREAATQHLCHTLPAVDHSHREDLPRGFSRREGGVDAGHPDGRQQPQAAGPRRGPHGLQVWLPQ